MYGEIREEYETKQLVEEAIMMRISGLHYAMFMNILVLALIIFGMYKLHEQDLIQDAMFRNDKEAMDDEQIINDKKDLNGFD